MTDYPRLAEMGVTHPEEIVHFSVNSLDYTDHLRIFYKRPTGSLLASSRSYEFPRVQKKLKTGSESGQPESVMESSPAFRDAVAELESILGKSKNKQDLADALLDEVRRLEEEVAMHSVCLKGLIEKIRSV